MSATSHNHRRAVGVAAAKEGLVTTGVAANRGGVAAWGSHSDQSLAPTPSPPSVVVTGRVAWPIRSAHYRRLHLIGRGARRERCSLFFVGLSGAHFQLTEENRPGSTLPLPPFLLLYPSMGASVMASSWRQQSQPWSARSAPWLLAPRPAEQAPAGGAARLTASRHGILTWCLKKQMQQLHLCLSREWRCSSPSLCFDIVDIHGELSIPILHLRNYGSSSRSWIFVTEYVQLWYLWKAK
jgi:hypothetical protein